MGWQGQVRAAWAHNLLHELVTGFALTSISLTTPTHIIIYTFICNLHLIRSGRRVRVEVAVLEMQSLTGFALTRGPRSFPRRLSLPRVRVNNRGPETRFGGLTSLKNFN